MLDFPTSPAVGAVFGKHVWDGTRWTILRGAKLKTALPRNRFINPDFSVTQEYARGSNITSSGWYAADGWYNAFSNGSLPPVMRFKNIESPTPRGGRYRLLLDMSSTRTLQAGEYGYVGQNMEGLRIADFLWGTANARQVILRFGFRGPAGKYSVCIRNAGAARSYLANFTISAGQSMVDTEHTLVIPGDTTGTWPTDASTSLVFGICYGTGTTYQGALGWQAGNKLGTSDTYNFMGVGTNDLEIFDMGLYLDLAATGIAPPWSVLTYAENLEECMRYFWKGMPNIRDFNSNFYAAGAYQSWPIQWPVHMRVAPSVTLSRPGGALGNANAPTMSSINTIGGRLIYNSTVATVHGYVTWGSSDYIIADARP